MPFAAVHKIRKNLGKLALVFLLTLVVAELGLRLAGSAYRVKGAKEPDPNRYMILCMGESSTVGYGVAPEETYPNRLEQLLNAENPDQFQVVYDGEMGANSRKMVALLPDFLRKYRPRMIIAMIGVNNHIDLDRSNRLLFSRNKTVSETTYKIMLALNDLRLVKLARVLYYRLGRPAGIYEPGPMPEHRRRLLDNLLRDDLREIKRFCDANDIILVFSGYPTGTLRDLHQEMAKELGVPFVDNQATFAQLDDINDYLLDDHWHPNAAGYQLIAQDVQKTIGPLLPDKATK